MDQITFPIDILSLQNYINDQSTFSYKLDDKISQKYANYTLKSVVSHRGASSGGHYWSVIKEFGQWYEIDD
jgi:ubiquitin C-terminal hydrolase